MDLNTITYEAPTVFLPLFLVSSVFELLIRLLDLLAKLLQGQDKVSSVSVSSIWQTLGAEYYF